MRSLLMAVAAITISSSAFAVDPPKDTPSAAQSRKKLKGKVTVEFKNTMLDEALTEISGQIEDQKLGPISKIYGVGVSKNTRVNYAGKDVTVEEALDGILKQLDLGYTILSKPGDRQDGFFEISKGNHRGYAPGVTPPAGSMPVASKTPDPKPEPKPEVKPEPKPEPSKPAETVGDADEKNAQSRMDTAKKLIEDNKAAEAVKLLKYVVKYYPTTKGAAEAKELLEKMK
jgi:hypothetical protein